MKLFLLLCLCSPLLLFAQSDLDFLLKETERKDLPDTQRVKLYCDLAEIYRYSDAQQAGYYSHLARKLAEKTGNPESRYLAYENLGNYYLAVGLYDSSELFLKQAIALGENNQIDVMSTYNAMGNLFFYQSEYDQALSWYLNVMDMAKQDHDSSAMARAYGNVGNVYYYLQDIPKVKENFLKSLEIKEALKDSAGIAHTMGNMGNLYYDEQNFDSALYYYETSLSISRRQNNVFNMSLCLMSLADVHLQLDELNKAEQELQEAIEYCELLQDSHGLMRSYHMLAPIYYKKGNLSLAIKTYLLAIEKSKELGSKEFVKDGYLNLSKIHEENGTYKEALENYKLFHQWSDSVLSEKKNEAIAEMLTVYRTKEIEDSLQLSRQTEEMATLKAKEAEMQNRAKSRQLWLLSGILLLMIGLVALVVYHNQLKKKANKLLELKNFEISNQKAIIEEKHAEITDSIAYAKRIQTAILPPLKLVKQLLKESFIIYIPKDVVAGDFYWMSETDDAILFAAADCTGHGVPGAMVSVVCNNALNRAVKEFRLIDPAEILNKTREIVIAEFEKSDEEVKDGMDISLCSLSLKSNLLKWSGANNPLWILRKNQHQIEEIKADKQPIGKFSDAKPFTTHTIQLQPDDQFYIFTDGYQDQFGGTKGKKLKAANFRTIIEKMSLKEMDQQADEIRNAFEAWRGSLEQVDDVCVIGVKIS